MARGLVKNRCAICGTTKEHLNSVTFEVTKKVEKKVCDKCKSRIK